MTTAPPAPTLHERQQATKPEPTMSPLHATCAFQRAARNRGWDARRTDAALAGRNAGDFASVCGDVLRAGATPDDILRATGKRSPARVARPATADVPPVPGAKKSFVKPTKNASATRTKMIHDLHKMGYSKNAIADGMGIDPTTVLYHLGVEPPENTLDMPAVLLATIEQLGLTLTDMEDIHGRGRAPVTVRNRERLWVALREKGLSYPEIGRLVGRTHSTIVMGVHRAVGRGDVNMMASATVGCCRL